MDLRKPLEGVPGLLLMAALILFGATIGISFAIGFTWIRIGDALANFLGGVVGAALGAALAVLGAVYVQRRDTRSRLAEPINLLTTSVIQLRDHLEMLQSFLKVLTPAADPTNDQLEISARLLDLIEERVKELPDAKALPGYVYTEVLRIREDMPRFVLAVRDYLETVELGGGSAGRYEDRLRELAEWRRVVGALLEELEKL
jgi:hypothetical protein